MEGDCDIEVDLADLGLDTTWVKARLRVLNCADNSPYAELTELNGYGVVVVPFNPDSPLVSFLLANEQEGIVLIAVRPPF